MASRGDQEANQGDVGIRVERPIFQDPFGHGMFFLCICLAASKSSSLQQALALSLVAHSDYPDSFPEFLPSLFSILQSGNSQAVQGALDVLKEFLQQDLPEEQLMDFLKEIAPVLLSLLSSPTVGSFHLFDRTCGGIDHSRLLGYTSGTSSHHRLV